MTKPHRNKIDLRIVRVLAVASAMLIAGCTPFTLQAPDNFDAETVEVSGRTKNLHIGPYRLSNFDRGWTRGNGLKVLAMRSAKQAQKYEFRLARDSAWSAATQCEFAANEKSFGGDGFSLSLSGSAELNCAIVTGAETHALVVSKERDEVLAGTYTTAAPHTYRVQGIGYNKLSKGKTGPVGGFHIFDGDVAIATVQVINDKRVTFARGLPREQRDVLAPAIAALLLLDETITDM